MKVVRLHGSQSLVGQNSIDVRPHYITPFTFMGPVVEDKQSPLQYPRRDLLINSVEVSAVVPGTVDLSLECYIGVYKFATVVLPASKGFVSVGVGQGMKFFDFIWVKSGPTVSGQEDLVVHFDSVVANQA